MSMNDLEAARKMNGQLSWYDRREEILKAFDLWDHYGQVPKFADRDAHHREWFPGGSER